MRKILESHVRFVAVVALLTAAAFEASESQASESDVLGFVETFALADDRAETLKELIPGSEAYYFYHALHYQNSGQADRLQTTLSKWRRRTQSSELRDLITRRERLLSYDKDPQATLRWLREELGLHFNHQREKAPGQKPDLPTKLDPQVVSREAFIRRATMHHDNLAQFQDSALDWVLRDGGVELTSGRRRALLSRLDRPDYQKLVQLIAADLRTKESQGFGEFKIHWALLRDQLDELLERKPDLRTNTNFIHAYLTKLAPDADADLDDPSVRGRRLESMWAFVKNLAPAQNSLKAHVLHALLEHRRQQGRYDRGLFQTYVQLPRPMPYMNPQYLQRSNLRSHPVNLNQDFAAFTGCRPVGDDAPLVRDYLLHFLAGDDDAELWTEWLRDAFVKPLMAEAKIVSGAPDPERWASMLSPEAYQALKDRVDIDLAATNARRFSVDDDVVLAVDVKNVRKLMVKLYEINAMNVYLSTKQEISTALELDGLVAGSESEYVYQETPFQRTRREFSFPELKGKRGVWMIELIGGGRSSRAIIRKGGLYHISRPGVGGVALTVLDERDRPVPGASAWIADRKYTADEHGEITIPYSTKPQRRPLILQSPSGFASLTHLEHPAENYTLAAGFFVHRESLRRGGEAVLLIRPDFRINGVAAPLEVLKDVKLTIHSTNLDGVSATQEVPDFLLRSDKESTHKFGVPQRLSKLTFRLEAKVRQVSTGQEIHLTANASREINGIDASESTVDLHLSRFDGHAVLEVLGKTGERIADRPVQITFEHRDFKGGHAASLKSDDAGRIDLGELPGIARITAASSGVSDAVWDVAAGEDAHSRPAVLHAVEGETIHLPHVGGDGLSRRDYSLLDWRGETFSRDYFSKLSLDGGFLAIQGLPAGDYSLKIKRENRVILVRVAAGKMVGPFAAGIRRILETSHHLPLHITSIAEDGDELLVQLINAGEHARVHVVAARFEPAFFLRSSLGSAYQPPSRMFSRARFRNLYLSGRDIGDEYRYILERREQPLLPGNMLERPGLLLNPWALRETDTGQQQAASGAAYDDQSGREAPAVTAPPQAASHEPTAFQDASNLDFLATAGVLLANLKPDENGVVRISKRELANRQDLHVVAIGPTDVAFRRVSLADAGVPFRDLRLAQSLDVDKHFTERKEASTLREGDELTISKAQAAEMQAYDTLGSVFGLYLSRSSDATLAEFGFLLNWEAMEEAERRAKYSKYASHELNFFLSRKDPSFFEQVVRPYLRNKKDKTFMDHYLLGDDVKRFVEPWRYGRLNMAERVLLADRLGDEERVAAKRLLADLCASIPPNPAALNDWFAWALHGRSLEEGGESRRSRWGFSTKGKTASDGRGEDFDVANRYWDEAAGARFGRFRRAGEMAENAPAPASEPTAGQRVSRSDSLVNEGGGRQLSRAAKAMDHKRSLLSDQADLEVQLGVAFASSDDVLAAAEIDLARRQSTRELYRRMPSVKEWAENNYYRAPVETQLADRIPINAFWRDYAAYLADDGRGPFLSKHVAVPTSNFSEMMFALAVLDLPFDAGEHEVARTDGVTTFTADTPMIVFHKQIQPAALESRQTRVLVGQHFFRHDDRSAEVDGRKQDKYVAEEFLRGVVYGCQAVVTNQTSAEQQLDVLLQIPQGALPVLGSKQTRSLPVVLSPYATHKVEYYFYFPRTGDFSHYPVQVVQNEAMVASADPVRLHVVERLSNVDTASWKYVSQWGTSAEVLAYLEQHNVHQIDLGKIAWRMRDVDFFDQTLQLLSRRHAFHRVLWSYAIQHNRLPRIQEYLATDDAFLRRFGAHLDCTLVSVDPVERHWRQHLEYSPLVNARAHRLGRERRIVNGALRDQYVGLMNVLRYKQRLSDEDKLDVAYYLLLQGRAAEGLAWFGKVDSQQLPTTLQIDYLRCYVAFYEGQPADACRIAERYADYPVDSWRERFAQVREQAVEINGGPVADADRGERDREQLLDELASTEPALEMKAEDRQVQVTYQNVARLTVNYYEMDLEFLFSSNPFVETQGERFGVIKPNHSSEIELPPHSDTHRFDLPSQFDGKNVLVEVLGAGRRAVQAHYANSLKVQLAEPYGRLQVRRAGASTPLSKVYVKVYAQTPGGVKFYKDGYTDLRGKFDYASLNTDAPADASRFAILLMSREHGATVKTANPPQQ